MANESHRAMESKSGFIRTFIAVKVPLNAQLRPILRQLGEMSRAVKPVASGGLHLTLKFLGNTAEERCSEVEQQIQECVASQSGFELPIRGMGAFPSLRRPNVVWAGLQDDGKLESMTVELHERMMELGFEPDRFRLFRPHITLARVSARPPDTLKQLVQLHESTEFSKLEVNSISFIASKLTPAGPQYTTIRQFELC